MSFPGLGPTIVRVPISVLEVKIDPSRDAILVDPKTFHIIQAIKGGTKEKPPEGFIDFRDFSDEDFAIMAERLHSVGFPKDTVENLRKYRSREPNR